tara:strand:- start:32 stop:574 length:543 start_codon:yes stop_codon:yes gene_type:complete
MDFKKNKFIIFYFFNLFLLILILFLTIPFSNFLKKIDLIDNDYVKNQNIINPNSKSPAILERDLKVILNTEVDDSLLLDFKPMDKNFKINIGENKILNFKGTNTSSEVITSTAFFEVSPEKIFPYLIKTECFCFQEQILEPGESQIFSMVFFIDPALDNDKELNDIKDIVFTYRFSEYKS